MRILIVLLLLSGCAYGEPWTKSEKALLGVALTAQALDTAQTLTFLEKQNDGIVEANPLITNNESLFHVKALSAVVLGGIAHFLPHKQRKAVLTFWSILGAGVVFHNYKQGVRIGKDKLNE